LPSVPGSVPAFPSGPNGISSYRPPTLAPNESPWRPAPNLDYPFIAPRSPTTGSPEGSIRLFPPDEEKTKGAAEAPISPLLPVGIPQFAIAKDRVASGLKPFPDGLDWLKANGYRAVLHIRRNGEDDSAARRQVERSGLNYLSMEASPQSLSREIADEFNRMVDNPANLPLFVYDKEGMLAGGLWYLHFRLVEQASDEESRIRAARLGLKEDTDSSHREMWLAIQKLLGEMRRKI